MKWQPPKTKAGKPCQKCRPDKPCCKQHRQVGRPTVFTPESKSRFLAAKRLGASDRRACMAAGWTQQTFWNWKTAYGKGQGPDGFQEFFERELPKAEQTLYLKALNAIHDGLDKEQVKEADKRAQHALKVLQGLYGKDTEPAVQEHDVNVGNLKKLLLKHERRRKDATES